ncbi:MAG: tetratricopeptide repeat protein [Dolichospermum lemmermannii FEM_B0920]
MKLHKISHLLLFFILLFPASPIIITGCSSSLFARKPGTLSESELKDVLKEITVKVLVDDKEAASGTIIKKQNGFYTVLTNYHVIENAKSVKVVTPDNQVYPVEFSKVDRQDNQKDDLYDLAKLTFSSETTYLVAGLGEENIKPGEKVFAGGYVKGNLQTTKGTAKLFLNQPLIKGQQIAYDNDIQQGMSGGAIINEKGYLVGINSKLAHPVLQTDFRYLQGEQPDEKTLKEWGNYSWGIAVNLVDEAAPDLALFPERVIRKVGGIPAKVLDIAKQSSVQIKKSDGGIGSGVIIAKYNDVYYVLTAFHVVEDKQEYQVVAPDKQVYKVNNQTIRTRKGLDMAVLQFRSSQVYQVATLGDYKLSDNSPVVFLYGWKGEELNHPSLFSVGFMGSIDTNELWAKRRGYELAYTNEGYSGMSGGGVWDTEGRVVGIHNASITEVLGFSLGLSIETFLFHEREKVWNLPQSKLNIIDITPKDINSIAITTVRPSIVNSSGEDWLNYGIRSWRVQDFDDSIQAMKNAVIKKPDMWQAYYNTAWILFSKKQYDSALLAINTAINKQSSFYLSYLLKSLILLEFNQYTTALDSINKGIEEAKEAKKYDFWLYEIRGNILVNLKRYDEAITDFTQSITINPQYPGGYYNRGVTYSLQEKFAQAIDDYTQAIAIHPQGIKAYSNRAAAYYSQGKIDSAINDLTQAIAIDSQYATAYYNRGLIYYEQGNLEEAKTNFKNAIAINPKEYKIPLNFLLLEAYHNRASAYYKAGKMEQAIQDYTQIIAIDTKDAQVYGLRGVLYLLTGNKQQAIKDLETAKQLFQQQGNTQGYQKIQKLLNRL